MCSLFVCLFYSLKSAEHRGPEPGLEPGSGSGTGIGPGSGSEPGLVLRPRSGLLNTALQGPEDQDPD